MRALQAQDITAKLSLATLDAAAAEGLRMEDCAVSWSIGYDSSWKRDIGYGVPAICDHPLCSERINRGLAHVCGGEPYGGESGCGLYFCEKHLVGRLSRCLRCQRYNKTNFKPKPDVGSWIHHKLTDESWERWRAESPDEAAELSAMLVGMWGETRIRLMTELRSGTAAKDWEAWANEIAEILDEGATK